MESLNLSRRLFIADPIRALPGPVDIDAAALTIPSSERATPVYSTVATDDAGVSTVAATAIGRKSYRLPHPPGKISYIRITCQK